MAKRLPPQTAKHRHEHGVTSLRKVPVVACIVDAGDLVAKVRSDGPMSAWICPGAGWWPLPCVTGHREANSYWTVDRSAESARYVGMLRAKFAMAPGDEILADRVRIYLLLTRIELRVPN